jgi:required for meiotic nuclear division protein 1
VISQTAETLLSILRNRSSLRVEWYILVLIVAELALSIYPPALWR